jgi:hypothetical protein
MYLEYLTDKKLEDESKSKTCTDCNSKGIGKHCSQCGGLMVSPETYVDDSFDQYLRDIEAGRTPDSDWEDISND